MRLFLSVKERSVTNGTKVGLFVSNEHGVSVKDVLLKPLVT